jgi:ankyrin repeat protein
MVNLIVSHGSHLQGNSLQRSKSPAVVQRQLSPKLRRDAGLSLQIQSHASRPSMINRLAASDSVFDTRNHVSSYNSSDSSSNRFRDKYSDHRDETNEEESTSRALTCDYDKNVTQLYEMLESSQWEDVIGRCHDNPEEVRTWINRRGRWQVLPLHAAIIFHSPKAVIEQILKIHPLACSEIDDQGMLPLHLAFRHKLEESLLELLLGGYPQGIHCKDKRGRTPIEHAKEAHFTAKFIRLYAEASCSQDGIQNISEERNTSYHESQVASLEMMYEKRIEDLERNHEESVYRLKIKAEQDQEKLRDFLSEQVTSSQRSPQLESEVHELHSSLEQANQETRVLRRLLKKQRDDQKQLKDKFQLVLSNQQALHESCTQQQEKLQRAQKMREKMLRSLLEKEEGENAFGVSSQICEVSSNIMTSTEQIFSHIMSVHEMEGDQCNPIEVLQEDEVAVHIMEQDNYEWSDRIHEHDEISGITEISHF